MSDNDQLTPNDELPTIYHIRIKERLGELWQVWFEGMTITHEDNGETVMTGQIIDQAQLFGLLKRVRNLGLTLISITRTDPDGSE